MVKNWPANAGDIRDSDSIPGSGRSPGAGNGNPLQCSCLDNPRDGGAWWTAVYGVAQSRTRMKRLSIYLTISFFRFFSHIDHYRISSSIPLLSSRYLFIYFIYTSIYVYVCVYIYIYIYMVFLEPNKEIILPSSPLSSFPQSQALCQEVYKHPFI